MSDRGKNTETEKIPVPAPGHRGYGEGALWSLGNYGFSWSSATGGICGLDLRSHSQYLNASYADYRGHGLQLRCLSE